MGCSHVTFMSGDAWKNGGIDSTGTSSVEMRINAKVYGVCRVQRFENVGNGKDYIYKSFVRVSYVMIISL